MNILIVEDSQFCTQLLESILSEEGHETVCAVNGLNALKYLVGDPVKYDLIISDVFMPEMNGLELFRTLAQNQELQELPIVLTSNAADRNTVIEAASMGCKYFLVKPLNAQKVHSIIQKIFPERKTYLKARTSVCELMHLGKDDYENLLRDYQTQVQDAYTVSLAGVDARNNMPGLPSLVDGMQLLGTSQLAEDLKNHQRPDAKTSQINDFLGELIQQIQIKLAIIDVEHREELEVLRQESREKLKKEFAEARKAEEAKEEAAAITAGAPITRQGRKTLADLKDIQQNAAAQNAAKRDALLAAAKAGDTKAQFGVAMGYLRGRDGFPAEEEEGLRWLEMSAAKGFPDAMCQLALTKIQRCQSMFQPEWDQATNLINNAANLGHKEAAYWRGELGKGFKPGSDTGISLIADAKQGVPTAQFKLGLLYDRGIEIPQNTPEAIFWLTHSAEQGHSNAQHRLGIIYESGRGGNDGYPLAVQWFEQAAEQGNVDAMLCLGRAYDTGLGVPKNESEAWKWYEAAAWKGNIRAQYSLGQLIEESEKMVNTSEALKWYLVSAKGGYSLATRRAEELKNALTPGQYKNCELEAEQIIASLEAGNKVR